MTCIVGVIQNKKVYIGGDSAGVSDLDISIRKDPKVFKIGEFVIGCCGSFRMTQLLRYSFCPPTKNAKIDIFRYMCTDFIEALRTCFKNGGFSEINANVESGGVFLVGYKDRLFNIQSDYQVAENSDNFDSIGCGETYALGALCAMNKKLSAIAKIKKALNIAVYKSGGVRPPFIIENT